MLRGKLRALDLGVAVRKVRTTALVCSGLGAVDFGVWQIHHPSGWIAAGLSLLVLDWLADDTEETK